MAATWKDRPGQFKIAVELLKDIKNPEDIFKKLDVVIVRAEHIFHSNTIEYVGYSPLFRKTKPGEEAPPYTLIVSATDDGAVCCVSPLEMHEITNYRPAERTEQSDRA